MTSDTDAGTGSGFASGRHVPSALVGGGAGVAIAGVAAVSAAPASKEQRPSSIALRMDEHLLVAGSELICRKRWSELRRGEDAARVR
jgi:hypothetical protein